MATATVIAPVSADGRERAAAFDLKRLDPAFLDDPYPTYRALREHDPVHRMPDGSYFLTRYDDLVCRLLLEKKNSSDKTVDFKPNFGDSLLYEHHTTSLVFNDPPVHTRVRKLLGPAFSPRALKPDDFMSHFGESLLYEHLPAALVSHEPPVHTPVLKLLGPAFSPRALK